MLASGVGTTDFLDKIGFLNIFPLDRRHDALHEVDTSKRRGTRGTRGTHVAKE